MRWRRYVVGAATLIVLAWSAIAIAQSAVEQRARAMLDAWAGSPLRVHRTFKYGDIEFVLAERRLVISNIEFIEPKNAGRWTIEAVSIVDPDLAALEKVVDSVRYRAGRGEGDFMPVASRMQIRNIRFKSSTNEWGVGSIAAGSVALRQFAVPPSAGNSGRDLRTAIESIVPGIRASEIVATDLRVVATKDAKAKSAASITVQEIDAGRIAAVHIDDIRFDEGEDTVTVGSLTMTGIDLTRALEDLAAGRKSYDPARAPHADHWEMRALGGPALARHGISIARLRSDTTWSADGAIGSVEYRIDGIDIAPATDEDSPMAAALTALGYPSLRVAMACTNSVDTTRKTWNLELCSLTAPGAGTLSLELGLSNVDLAGFAAHLATPDQLRAPRAEAALVRMRLAYEDDGLARRMLNYLAQGVSQPGSLRLLVMIARMERIATANRDASPRIRALSDAIVAFAKRPGALTIALSPAEPVPLQGIDVGRLVAELPEAADRFGLTSRYTPP